jgi:guanidinopropionase
MAEPRSYLPVSGMELPRFAGIPTFMRLPHVPIEAAGDVQIGLIGVPWDGGTTNRPGPRHGPRQLRDLSTMIRNVNQATGINPWATARCADLDDAPVNPADLQDSMARIAGFYERVLARGIVPMSAGGDHLVSLPILRGLAGGRAPLAMIHFDAHTDFYDSIHGGHERSHADDDPADREHRLGLLGHHQPPGGHPGRSRGRLGQGHAGHRRGDHHARERGPPRYDRFAIA